MDPLRVFLTMNPLLSSFVSALGARDELEQSGELVIIVLEDAKRADSVVSETSLLMFFHVAS